MFEVLRSRLKNFELGTSDYSVGAFTSAFL
jgi:hypothetical protein